MFDATGKIKELKKEVRVDARFSMKCSTLDSIGKNPIGFNPVNQMTNVGKILRILTLQKSHEIPLNQRSP